MLSNYKVDGETTAEYTFVDLPDQPTLICAPATKQNKEYFREMIKRPMVQKILNKRKLSDKDSDAALDEVIDLYATHVIRAWSDMQSITQEDKEPSCTVANKKKFLKALINGAEYLWEDFASWVQEPRNFTNFDVEDKAKN